MKQTLDNFDHMYFRAIKTGCDAYMLELMGMDYMMDWLEYQNIQDAIEEDMQKQVDRRNKSK